MACEILIKTEYFSGGRVNYTHPDPEKDRTGVYKKGYPVTMKQIPHPGWGTKEGLPYFVRVTVTDADVEDVEDMVLTYFDATSLLAVWRRFVDWSVVNNNPTIDGWRLRIFATNPGATNFAGLTRDMVETFLNNWNAEVFSAATNEVVFDVAVYEDGSSNPGALQSEGFWTGNTSLIDFTEDSYNETTGEHVVTADYTSLPLYISDPDKATILIKNKIEERGGVILSNDSGIAQFSITRLDVLNRFKAEVKRRLEKIIYRKQLRIPESTVDNIVSQGGSIEITLSQLQSYIINRLDEDL